MLALLKAFGIGADVAASAVAARYQKTPDYSLATYVRESLKVGLAPENLTQVISNWAWSRSVVRRAPGSPCFPAGFKVREFQDKVACSSSFLTFAQAGCGSGKSLAAYLWARKWCERYQGNRRTNFRLFVCLPTTGTTTEHFKDYALESGIDSSLTHSRSSIDLQTLAETAPQEEGPDTIDPARLAQAALNAERDKIESLALWSTPLVVTTADTVLGLMSNARKAVYSLPATMCGAIVFDESPRLRRSHVWTPTRVPEELSLPARPADDGFSARRAPSGSCAHPPGLMPIPGPPDFELLKRYEVAHSSNEEEVWCKVKEVIGCNGKVLWVCNRVGWANATYAECRRRFADVEINAITPVFVTRIVAIGIVL